MKIIINKWCPVLANQKYEADGFSWSIIRLIELSKDLEVFEIPLSGLNLCSLYPKINNMLDFVGHMKQVNDANLKYPIILDNEGFVIDGRHRIAKALLNNKQTIKAVRFQIMPGCDGKIDE